METKINKTLLVFLFFCIVLFNFAQATCVPRDRSYSFLEVSSSSSSSAPSQKSPSPPSSTTTPPSSPPHSPPSSTPSAPSPPKSSSPPSSTTTSKAPVPPTPSPPKSSPPPPSTTTSSAPVPPTPSPPKSSPSTTSSAPATPSPPKSSPPPPSPSPSTTTFSVASPGPPKSSQPPPSSPSTSTSTSASTSTSSSSLSDEYSENVNPAVLAQLQVVQEMGSPPVSQAALVSLNLDIGLAEKKVNDPQIKALCDKTGHGPLCLAVIAPFYTGKSDLYSLIDAILRTATEQTNKVMAIADQLATDPKFAIISKVADRLTECKSHYDDALDNIKEAIAAIGRRDPGTILTMISAAISDYDSCDGAFEGQPNPNPEGTSPLADINKILMDTADIVLNFSNRIK